MGKCAICKNDELKCDVCIDYSEFEKRETSGKVIGISQITVSYGKTISRWNFNSERYDFSITVNLDQGDNPAEVAKDAWDIVKDQVSIASESDDAGKNFSNESCFECDHYHCELDVHGRSKCNKDYGDGCCEKCHDKNNFKKAGK